MEELAQLEVLCERLYKSQSSAERAHAEKTLECFSKDTNYISQCQYILDNASTSYALMMASTSLLKQVTHHQLHSQLLLEIRNYVLSYLASRGEKLESFVIGSLIQLLCRVTKVGWIDDEKFKEVVKETMNFLNQGPSHYAIGLKILIQLIAEMNQAHPALPDAQRRISRIFKERQLLNIFQISLSSLQKFKSDVGSNLQGLAISLSLSCLSFDFSVTPGDESSNDIGTIQIPVPWRQILEDPLTVQIFFDYYAISQDQMSKEALECLVCLTSVRRTTFTNESSRGNYLSRLMMGTKEILQTGIGLSDHDNYHVFCRLLACFKSNYQLADLINADGFSDWIVLIAEFTMKSLQSWKWASNSVYYVLGLWSRLVTSVTYLKDGKPNILASYVPVIVESFVSTRFDSLQSDFSDELSEDPLDNAEHLQDELDFFPYLCRFQYESCCSSIVNVLEPILQMYTNLANLQACADNAKLSLIESKLAWMVHIVAAVLKTKQLSGCGSDGTQELHDAELSARIFQLMKISDIGPHQQRYGEPSKQRLDRALLTFIIYFKKSYVGDQAMHSSNVIFDRLSTLVGLHDHLQALNAFIGKIATNLKSYAKCKELIDRTLSVFLEMTSGYMSVKMLLKLDAIKFILSNPNKEHFPFLEEKTCLRSRTNFYFIIGLLIFKDEDHLVFKRSMDPLMQVSVSLGSISDAMFRSDVVKYALIGLTRDLRGIIKASHSRKSYGFIFGWLYPSHFHLLLKGISNWFDASEVTTPILKCVAELVQNMQNRINFDSSSPNGILLFREVSKLLVTYGSRIISVPNTADLYTSRYKGIRICLTILTRALSGQYVNFGVLEVYGDRALVEALDISLKMITSIPLADMLAYPKLAVAYFTFLVEVFRNHLSFITSLDTSSFMYILESLDSGLKGFDNNVSSKAASAIDDLASFYFLNVTMGESHASPVSLNLAQRITEFPALFPQILKTLCDLVTLEDRMNQWSLTRPMLSLILISEEMFTSVKNQLILSQPLYQQESLSVFFGKIMEGVNRSLEATNRDKFTQNVSKSKHTLQKLY